MRIVEVLAVAVLLTVVLVLAGPSLTGGDRGEDGSTPAASSSDAAVQPEGGDSVADQDATDDTAATPDAADPSASKGESYEALKEQLLEELDEYQAPVGGNARNVADEQGILTVAELSAQLESRGFPTMEIIATFALDGTYLGETVLDPQSAERYPSYRMSYQSECDVLWAIVVNGRAYLAVPLSTAEVALQREIILSETDTVVQFDGSTGQYSDFTFDELGDAVGVTVAQIDRATLDSYTAQELGDM